ncbi:MAG: DUF3237 domain-containing protein [Ferruginibacter sp.]
MNNFKFQLEHIFTFGALLQSPEVIGPVAEGIKVNFYALGGEMTGPKMNGKCRAVGGDWLTLRTDGVAILDVRTTLETNDGALIAVNYTGVGDLGPDGHKLFLEGKLPPRLALQVVPRCQTAHPDYLWLNRLQCLGIGEVDMEKLYVSYDIYAVRG